MALGRTDDAEQHAEPEHRARGEELGGGGGGVRPWGISPASPASPGDPGDPGEPSGLGGRGRGGALARGAQDVLGEGTQAAAHRLLGRGVDRVHQTRRVEPSSSAPTVIVPGEGDAARPCSGSVAATALCSTRIGV